MDPSDLKVLISYKDLQELLHAVEEIPQIRQDMERYHAQVVALKGINLDIMERLGEIMKLI